MAKIDVIWNPNEERPLAIAMCNTSPGNPSRFVMTTTLGRVLTYIPEGTNPRVWHDITPQFVRTDEKRK